MMLHAGVGLRQPHLEAALAGDGAAAGPAFVEVHSENYFGDGGAALAQLQAARERWPLSLHGVGLALGSAAGLDRSHLDRLQRLVQRMEPVRVSDHASFARAPRRRGAPVLHAADLLPVAFTEAALAILAANVSQVQDRLRRPLLVENLSACVQWADDALAEPEFFNELARRSGCALLLDVNNLVVNALNEHGRAEAPAVAAACAWIDRLRPGIVGEIHLAGYGDGGELVIDDHGSRVHAPVWQVYRHALQRLGPQPTLVEWDTNLPPWPVLLGEAAKAEALIAACRGVAERA
jgi:uncharacterized protein (UPF0276 family)